MITIARVILGVIFALFGLNGFLNFISMPRPSGIAAEYMGALFVSHYLAVIFALELIAGALLVANRFVPLALAILAPILFNIGLFHALMSPEGIAPALIAIGLWIVVFYHHRTAFSALFVAKSPFPSPPDELATALRRVPASTPSGLIQDPPIVHR